MKHKEIFMGAILFIFTFILFFIANNYDKRKAQQKEEQKVLQSDEEQAITSNYTYYDASRSIVIGDSRMYLASKIIKDNDILFVAKNGATCNYLWETAEKETDKILEENAGEHFNIFINLGVNDLNRIEKGTIPDGKYTCNGKMYSDYYLKLKEKWSEHNLFIISVNPVDKENLEKGKHKNGTNNDKIKEFNNEILKEIESSGIYYCDTYSQLLEEGFESSDGLHYSDNSSKRIIEKLKKCSEEYERKKKKIQNMFSL